MGIKLLELFGGIGSPRKALCNLGYDIHSVDYVEIDKKAVASYNAIFNENYQTKNIVDIDGGGTTRLTYLFMVLLVKILV